MNDLDRYLLEYELIREAQECEAFEKFIDSIPMPRPRKPGIEPKKIFVSSSGTFLKPNPVENLVKERLMRCSQKNVT